MKSIRYDQDADGVVTLTFDEPNSPVNVMSAAWQASFNEAVDRLDAGKDSIRGVILASAKTTFFAGADLKAVMALEEADAAQAFREIEAVKARFRKLDRLGKPVVAALNGTALGGGFEIALAAHHRIAVDDPGIQLGFPEVTLGLLPGAGGVTKMVRLLGLEAAFPYLVEGKLFGVREAAKLGLVHELVLTPEGLRARAREWIAANPSPVQPWDDPKHRIPGGTPSTPRIAQMLAVAPAALVEKTRHNYPAPEAIMACMAEGAAVDYDTAMRIESRHLARLMVGQNARNMIKAFFFDMNAVKSGASRPKGPAKWRATRVGILGAGMMGSGIAWANATRRVPCVLKDIDLARAQKGRDYTARLLAKRVQQGRMTESEAEATLALVTPAAANADLAGCDLVIEAVFENRELKAQVTREVEPLLAPDGIFASNTSTLPITSLARASARPERFVGLHFFSPVDKMRLVEIIRGRETSDETLARAYDYVLQIGKLPIVVNDSRGFFTSRVFGTFVMEGVAMLEEGIPAAAVENAGRQAGMPVGPLAVVDETSLSLAVHVREEMRKDLEAEGKPYVVQPGEALVLRMVKEFGRPGRAGGGGFYDYPQGAPKSLWPGLKQFEKPDVAWDVQELKDRLLYRQAIETARCLQEGVLASVHDANIGSIFGIGFPAWTGGALQFINSEGPAKFVARADALAAKHGPRFAVPEIVRAKAAAGELFT
ncbi:MAG: 3-hydroxyacyl-CoA dehydrogenase NAD-binding domain-containing protein [Burkholderiales bacterium]|nr:3-hydroxyacyl-CoA dehydrogenase NAD-binding domain-containing protein [Burkholderiales bacterium]